MIVTILKTVDLLLWGFMAFSVGYVSFFSLVSLFCRRRRAATPLVSAPRRFLVLIPAYAEDNVIRQSVGSVLSQDYPAECFSLAVVSDHMQEATNEWLLRQPLTLHRPLFDRSSKGRALSYAIDHTSGDFDAVVVLDADNTVGPHFLRQLSTMLCTGVRAIQCHRTAKNSQTSVALLDGASEEINNTLFRLAHNGIGLSSALIGSGMCFDYDWFRSHASLLTTAGEDRELEQYLLSERIHICYASHIDVFDEKVSTADNFQRQRLRWMTAQMQSLKAMLPRLPHALVTANVDYVDKTLQQALVPRAMLLVLLPVMGVVSGCALLFSPLSWQLSAVTSLKWWVLLAVLAIALVVALPRTLRLRALQASVVRLPQLAFRMLRNVLRINLSNHEFIHTVHQQ